MRFSFSVYARDDAHKDELMKKAPFAGKRPELGFQVIRERARFVQDLDV